MLRGQKCPQSKYEDKNDTLCMLRGQKCPQSDKIIRTCEVTLAGLILANKNHGFHGGYILCI